jgi:hypothetical protein
MRLSIVVSVVALLLAAVAAQNGMLQGIQAESPTSLSTACAVGAVECEDDTAANDGDAVVQEYSVLESGCPGADMHVVRYTPGDGPGEALVAGWCP